MATPTGKWKYIGPRTRLSILVSRVRFGSPLSRVVSQLRRRNRQEDLSCITRHHATVCTYSIGLRKGRAICCADLPTLRTSCMCITSKRIWLRQLGSSLCLGPLPEDEMLLTVVVNRCLSSSFRNIASHSREPHSFHTTRLTWLQSPHFYRALLAS